MHVIAIDLGAESGRVMRVSFDGDRLEQTEVHRFPNIPVQARGTLYWDVLRLWNEVTIGIAQAAWYPSLSLSASAGLRENSLGDLLRSPAWFWSPALNVLQLLFDGGERYAKGVLVRAVERAGKRAGIILADLDADTQLDVGAHIERSGPVAGGLLRCGGRRYCHFSSCHRRCQIADHSSSSLSLSSSSIEACSLSAAARLRRQMP